ncbi:MAG TPA: ATP-binding protein [Solirubrobacteraceae bacterium]|jgi:DNA replication protein DnaC|nr:ATP-binding protein [Solirubrobacteraceae bacterium]
MAEDFSAPSGAATQACPLGLCDGSGFVVDEAINTARDCECRPGRIAKLRIAGLEGRVPRHYIGVSFERPPVPEIARVAPEVVQEVRRYVREIDSKLDAGHGLWLMGDVGTGKTTLAMIVSKAALDAGRTVAIYSLPRLLNLIRDAIDSEGGMVAFLDRLAAVDLLHIDDLGAENTTDWVLEQLYSIINTRYEDERAMIVTTNSKYEELIEQLGERTVSRLVAICGNGLPLYGVDDRLSHRDRRENLGDELAELGSAPSA